MSKGKKGEAHVPNYYTGGVSKVGGKNPENRRIGEKYQR